MLIKYFITNIYFLIQFTLALRRIQNGQEVKSDKRYAVYFIKAKISTAKYIGWTCGGAIVSPVYIITAAACIEDVNHLYAIAGYKKFVDYEDLEKDRCTKNKKKKVVFTCVPKPYVLDYQNIEKWAYADIAVVKVESPFDFTDKSYETDCSYIPATIPINYEMKYQMPGVDAMALGWGHSDIWRMANDTTSYNSEYLKYASTLILDKKECKNQYKEEVKNATILFKIIDKYMICTLDPGNINDQGEFAIQNHERAEGCITKQEKLRGMKGVSCEDNSDTVELEIPIPEPREMRKERDDKNAGKEDADEEDADEEDGGEDNGYEMEEKRMRKNFASNRKSFRRNGICQNDHGGPLVTWVGAHEVLIGVASVFRVTKDYKCTGPYLFTSTQCNGKFLDCVINGDSEVESTHTNKPVNGKSALKLLAEGLNKTSTFENSNPFSKSNLRENPYAKIDKRRSCDRPPSELGYHMVKRRISWIDHPDGPADDELFDRPQVPLYNYHSKKKK